MNKWLAVFAVVLSALALYLPTRTQAFTRVTIDGRRVRMLVSGQGSATVVLENGAGAPLEAWGKVQPAVSRFAKTVSYDRAGMGLSDGPATRDGRRIAADLRRALHAAAIAPPYVLVGASLGGPYTRFFADMYPGDVDALVLVDPTLDQEAKIDTTSLSVRPGLPVFLIDAVSPMNIPFASEAVRKMRMNNRAGIEVDSIGYKTWLAAIPGSKLIVTNRSGHNVPIEQPELVVETIRDVIEEVTRRPRR